MRLLGSPSDGTSVQRMPHMTAGDAVRSFSRSLLLLPFSQPRVFGTQCISQGCCARKQSAAGLSPTVQNKPDLIVTCTAIHNARLSG